MSENKERHKAVDELFNAVTNKAKARFCYADTYSVNTMFTLFDAEGNIVEWEDCVHISNETNPYVSEKEGKITDISLYGDGTLEWYAEGNDEYLNWNDLDTEDIIGLTKHILDSNEYIISC